MDLIPHKMCAFPNQPAGESGSLRQVEFPDDLPVDQYDRKIALYPLNHADLVVKINNPHALSDIERRRLQTHISQRNFVVYQYAENQAKYHLGYQTICRQLGLTHSIANPASGEGNVTTIEVVENQTKRAARYIPFSNQPLKWHTDGYYNPEVNTVRSFVLHCRQPAESGGETCLLDHELVFALLHQQNPAWTTALAGADTMRIPANIQDGETIREAYCGPVFARDKTTGQLQMRYTERSRNIAWRSDSDTIAALNAVREILYDKKQWITRLTLQPGQGVIANNVLHNRSAFSDYKKPGQESRKLERIRFTDRISFEEEMVMNMKAEISKQ